jgi:hypothetical protein
MRKIILILALAIVFGCSNTDDPDIEFIPMAYWDVSLNCLLRKNSEYIIETEQELIEVAREILGDSAWYHCIDTTNLPVDFEKFILLGKYTNHDLNDSLQRTVIKPVDLAKITCKLELNKVEGPQNNGGFGNICTSGMNWIKIEKPPANFEVNIIYYEY